MIESKKGVKVRFIIHQILYAIKYQNISFDKIFEIKKKKENLKIADFSLINDVVLSSMRLFLYVNQIINIYIKKKPNKHQYILLLSSITQLVYLNYPNYAVINCAVEIAKNKKISAVPSFINGILKKIDSDKSKLAKINLKNKVFKKLPNKKIFDEINNRNKKSIFESVAQKPHTHLVFKQKININELSFNIIKSTDISGIINNNKSLTSIKEFNSGMFWVQDFSAMLPLYLTKIPKNFEALDMCSAPGGKTFQLIQKGAKVHAVEKSKGRVIKLKKNLNRLNYDSIIKIDDVLKLNEDKKYNIIIVDAPCSSIGTIRRNPDIFFKDKEINLDINIELQKKLLQKADKMLCAGGLLIYIVCSFLKKETYFPIKNFLKKNQNYSIFKYQDEKKYSKLIDDNGFINILPQRFNNFLIDGFFSARLIKND